MAPSDSELAARAQGGDLAAYEQLVRRHWEVLYRTAHAIIGNYDEAQDAAQEACVRAYGVLRRFDRRREFGPWIKGIAVNCALSAVRSQKRAERAQGRGCVAQLQEGPHEIAAAHDLQAALQQAIAHLPAQQRAAIRLFALGDMDLAQTAEVMGCAVGTVKAHLHRAREKLKGLLSDYLEEGHNREL